MSSTLSRLGALALLATASLSAHAASYTYTTLSRPGATFTTAWDVNNSGQIVGSTSGDTGSQGFIYSGGIFTSLSGPSGAISTNALGISDAGVVVGSYYTSSSIDPDGNLIFGPETSYIYSGGVYTSFTVPGSNNTEARAISPDGRYISGYYDSDAGEQGFVLDTLTNAFAFIGSGDGFTIAQGINNSYQVVGSDIISPSTRPGFIYDIPTGTRTDVLLPGSTRTAFRAIDNAGVIAGWYVAGGITHGFTGYPGTIQSIDVAGADSTTVEGSNDLGVLVGNYDVGDQTFAFVARPVPEPETWALMLAGIALLPLVRRRR